jgi:putative Mg2+ transporter-C (MgtC) family protein
VVCIIYIGSGFHLNTITEAILRLGLACILGAVIGIEREYKNHPAGLRTHLLVSFGACFIMILSIFLYQQTMLDTSRLAQGVISGIGFLGAGTIIREGNSVRGLTTAASIWTTACLGLAIGIGVYVLSIISTITIIFALTVLGKFEINASKKMQKLRFSITTDNVQEVIDMIYSLADEGNATIKRIDLINEETSIIKCDMVIRNLKTQQWIIQEINSNKELTREFSSVKIG